MKYVMNYGGGVNSTAMLFVLMNDKAPLDEVIFADTGAEMPQTYDMVAKIQEVAKANGILFTTVKSQYGNIYDYYFKVKTVPSRLRRDCTSKFKIQPIRNYLRTKYGKQETFMHYIGIAHDERHRVRLSDVKYATNAYPLVDKGIDRTKCIQINSDSGFHDVVKSGCWICPFTRKQGWLDLADKYPELLDKAIQLEENCPNKKTQLSHKPLSWFKKSDKQKCMVDFDIDEAPTCNGTGGCFL